MQQLTNKELGYELVPFTGAIKAALRARDRKPSIIGDGMFESYTGFAAAVGYVACKSVRYR